MSGLHQRLSELKRCFDDCLMNQEEYDLARREVIDHWISELFTYIMKIIS